ncbi:centrosomal protein of 41 kDa isoform X1 [Crotalus tigris]|uniref:centrosomal protein of 41 kDa isoform X1 n=2 Tax=Crotalus tigris TaxID=88082 RepID=UPI00192F8DC3|nr:centrosomal protein of 41 kDa isoform X1 [Crotalus tigris]
MSARRRIGDPEFLTKRIPQNPKYQHVKTRLDTGSSMTKYTEKLEEIKRNYRYKKDELFKRLKVTTFAQLVIQVATLSDETLKGPPEEGQKLDEGDAAPAETNLEVAETNGKGSPEEKAASPILFINNTGAGESYRSTLQSVISGVGELDLGKGDPRTTELAAANDGPYPDCPYLLLDVRERDAYDLCHLVGAYSYPIATLSRTMNPYTNSILEYKNAHGKIIILYDDDERVASQAATTMCERGFENVFMLSGGLRVIAQKIPEGLVTGSFPASCVVASHPGSARKKATPQPPLPTAATENKWRFTAEDLQKMQYYLQEEQLPSDPATRLSRGSSARDCKAAIAVRSSQDLPSTNPATAALTARSLSSSNLQSRPWR